MSKKPKPEAAADQPEDDMSTFEELPEETKELMKLKKQNEHSPGPELIEITEQIQEKTKDPKKKEQTTGSKQVKNPKQKQEKASKPQP